jgi:hypothetical protein
VNGSYWKIALIADADRLFSCRCRSCGCARPTVMQAFVLAAAACASAHGSPPSSVTGMTHYFLFGSAFALSLGVLSADPADLHRHGADRGIATIAFGRDRRNG